MLVCVFWSRLPVLMEEPVLLEVRLGVLVVEDTIACGRTSFAIIGWNCEAVVATCAVAAATTCAC